LTRIHLPGTVATVIQQLRGTGQHDGK